MAATLLVPPAAEPWTVADAKSFLRVEHDDDDVLIAALIASARGQVEALTRRGLITQTWQLVLDGWPHDGRIAPRLAPLRAVTAARVHDAAGDTVAIDVERFVVDAATNTIAAPPWSLPMPGRDVAGIELDVTVGFGDAASDVPDVLRHAVRTLVAHWYDNRGLAAIGASVAMLPGSVSAMIASYRVLSL